MVSLRILRGLAAALLLIAGCAGAARTPEVQYEPTPFDVVQAMLELAGSARRTWSRTSAAATAES